MHLPVHLGRAQRVGDARAQPDVVDAQPGVAGMGVPGIVPESIDPFTRMPSITASI